MKKTEPKTEIKNLKHTFSESERNQIGGDLARAISTLRGINAEFDSAKSGFKSRITASEAQIDSLSTALVNGFDMRNKNCVVVFRPKEKEKDYVLEDEWNRAQESVTPFEVALTEPMRPEDYHYELIQAESAFDCREEIEIFKPADDDNGVLVVGKFGGKWYGALRVKIGKLEIAERLDSEQKCFKKRSDAVSVTVKRFQQWSKENLKDLASGFQSAAADVIEAHKERED